MTINHKKSITLVQSEPRLKLYFETFAAFFPFRLHFLTLSSSLSQLATRESLYASWPAKGETPTYWFSLLFKLLFFLFYYLIWARYIKHIKIRWKKWKMIARGKWLRSGFPPTPDIDFFASSQNKLYIGCKWWGCSVFVSILAFLFS